MKSGDRWVGPYYGVEDLLISGVGVARGDFPVMVGRQWPKANGVLLKGKTSLFHLVRSKLDNHIGTGHDRGKISTYHKGPGEPIPNVWIHSMQKGYTFMYKPARPVLACVTENPTIPNIVFLSEPEDTIVYRV